MTATALDNLELGACTQDPDRWTTGPDNEAKALAGHARVAGCVPGMRSSPRVRKGCGQVS